MEPNNAHTWANTNEYTTNEYQPYAQSSVLQKSVCPLAVRSIRAADNIIDTDNDEDETTTAMSVSVRSIHAGAYEILDDRQHKT